MKNILFLTPYVPSSRAGGENFTRLLLENLSVSNHIDLVYYKYQSDPYYTVPNKNVRVLKVCDNSTAIKLRNCLSYPVIHPLFSIRYNRNLLNLLRETVRNNHYDLLYLDHSQMFLYGKYFPKIKKILMAHDVMAQRFSRTGNLVNRKLVLSAEGKLMSVQNSTIFTFSEKDCNIIKAAYGLESRATNFFLDQMVIDSVPTQTDKRIVFFGKWKRADNFEGLKWFFDNVYEKLDKSICISIIGKWLPDAFEKELRRYGNVEYLGFVENPYTMIANSMATVSPLFSGAGVKVKVVESLACGTPVIGNDIAFEGISEIYNQFMIKADTPEEYANAINNISISIEERQKYKQMFIENYIGQSIVTYIDNC